MNHEEILFLLNEVYPYVDDPNLVDVRSKPTGNPPSPDRLTLPEYEEWAEYVRMVCAQIENNEAVRAEKEFKAGKDGTLSARGEMAVRLVDLLFSD